VNPRRIKVRFLARRTLLLLLLLLSITAVSLAGELVVTAASRHPARSSSSAKPATTAPQLVVLGDSVPAGTACQCVGFAGDLSAKLGGTLTNAAVAGLTSRGLVNQLNDRILQRVLKVATVVTITVGANDFDESLAGQPSCQNLACYDDAMAGLAVNMDTILTRIVGLVPSTSVIVVTGYWNVFLDGQVGAAKGPVYVQVSDALTRQVNSRMISASIVHTVDYSDIYTPFNGPGDQDDTALLAADGDHPNAAGHHLIATALQESLRVA
jgi:lysophospholipase L1-like esterase